MSAMSELLRPECVEQREEDAACSEDCRRGDGRALIAFLTELEYVRDLMESCEGTPRRMRASFFRSELWRSLMIISWGRWVEDIVDEGDVCKYVAELSLGTTCVVLLYMPRLL